MKIIQCQNQLGEGIFWSFLHQKVFWFDILQSKIFSCGENGRDLLSYQLPFMASYGYPIDDQILMILCEYGLYKFDLISQDMELFFAIEEDNPLTRSNDAHLDQWGNLWLSTMGKNAQHGWGNVYVLTKDKSLHKVFSSVSIPNSLAVDIKNRYLYFTDSKTQKIIRYNIQNDLSLGAKEIFSDRFDQNTVPDGSCLNHQNQHLFNAVWGGGKVMEYTLKGDICMEYYFPTTQISCCTIGGKNNDKLFVTSAYDGLDRNKEPLAGSVFICDLKDQKMPY